MLEEIKMRSVSPRADSHIDGSVEAMPVIPLVPHWPAVESGASAQGLTATKYDVETALRSAERSSRISTYGRSTTGSCLCGGPLCAEGEFVACEHCRRLYCPDCGGPVVHGGGCESCVVCGYGYCA